MKFKALLLASIGLVPLALGAQDTMKFVRTFKDGDTDSYKMHMTMTMPMGDADVAMTMSQKVVKVYDNGEADLETSFPDFKVSVNGNEMPVPVPQPKTAHVDKHGVPVGDSKGGMESSMQFARYSGLFYDRDIKVGDTIPIDYTDPKDPKQKVTGTIKMDSVSGGDAKLIEDIAVTLPDATDPLKLNMVVLIDTATSKLDRIDGNAASIPAVNGMQISNMKFSMERIKS